MGEGTPVRRTYTFLSEGRSAKWQRIVHDDPSGCGVRGNESDLAVPVAQHQEGGKRGYEFTGVGQAIDSNQKNGQKEKP